MSKLTTGSPSSRELVTEVLDEMRWWDVLNLTVEFLRRKGVETVRVEFGYVLGRDLAGEQPPPDQTVELGSLESLIKTGLATGTIEWKKASDFVFHAPSIEMAFMLCNDADLHVASGNSVLLEALGGALRSSGIKVYGSEVN
jgi:hypothetical protein